MLLDCVAPYDSTNQRMHIILSMLYLNECAGCPPRPDSLQMDIDWVRVWQ